VSVLTWQGDHPDGWPEYAAFGPLHEPQVHPQGDAEWRSRPSAYRCLAETVIDTAFFLEVDRQRMECG
jgi:hypothetical protein